MTAAIMETSKHIDYKKLLDQFNNDKESVNHLLDVFLKNCNEDVPALIKALENENKEEIKRLSHKLKSSFLSINLLELHNVAKELEALLLVNDSDFENIKNKVNYIAENYNKIKEEVMEYQNQ